MGLNRRGFVQAGALGAAACNGLLACAGKPPAASAAVVTAEATVLDPALHAVADALADALVPGAAAAGFAAYLDTQLGRPAGQSLLIARYLGIEPPWRDFYLPALRAIGAWARARYGADIAELDAAARAAVVRDLAAGTPSPWDAAPPPFVYFVLRADAIDVAWGTRAGFARLGVPYMAHIEPERDW